MIVYQKTKAEFLDDAFTREISEVVQTAFIANHGFAAGQSEVNSWQASLGAMARVLNDEAIPNDCGVAIEYGINQTGKRIDLMLSGKDAEQRDKLVVVELKQWENANKTDKDGVVEVWLSGRNREVSHPSYQAWSYTALLESYNDAIYEGRVELKPCAFLHNCVQESPVVDSFYDFHLSRAPVFLRGEAEKAKLRNFIKSHVKQGDNGDLIYRIENGKIKPSKSLIDSLQGLLNGNQEFVLIDDQKVVFESVLVAARKAKSKPKRVVIVDGGPGTGKSVVAINLLVALTSSDLVAKYVTKNAAPRAVFQQRLLGSQRRNVVSNMFVGSGAFTETAENELDVLVVDEAHRLNAKSGLYANLGENQIKELIGSAKCSIFFLDEDQRVTLADIGTKDEIRKWAAQYGAKVTELSLSSQFRCNGSDGYLAWLDDALQLRETANKMLNMSEYDFRVFDDPEELRRAIFAKNAASNKARMVAGYCWDWVSKRDSSKIDVRMPEFGFGMKWNLTDDGGLWMIAKESVSQIGCIHTAQGLEADYIGVIVGADLVVRSGKVETNPAARSKNDRSIFGYKKAMETAPRETAERVDRIIRNTYRTLMTRGLQGCYVYFVDAEAREYFKSRIAPPPTMSLPRQADVKGVVRPFQLLSRQHIRPYENCVPVVDLKLAAGSFGEFQQQESDGLEWASLPDVFRPQPGLFIAQVVGESMNKRIPNGAWCLFRAEPKGTRQGKIVVAQHRAIQDPELGGSYTVKVYESEKISGEHEWAHSRILLHPDSTDSRFKAIEIQSNHDDALRIVAEFVAVL